MLSDAQREERIAPELPGKSVTPVAAVVTIGFLSKRFFGLR